MRLLGLNLENFRNLASVNLEFSTDRVFFIGSNGQGKSNLLEAIGISSNLRSFRGATAESMVREGADHARVFARFLDDCGGEREALVTFRKRGSKEVEVDGVAVRRLGDLLGQFPAVCLSSRDFRLVRESPSDRRKWMDLVLSSTSAQYLYALQKYYRAMKERNTLLKKQATDSEILAFERVLSDSAHSIQSIRFDLFPVLNQEFEKAYAKLSDGGEQASLQYSPDSSPDGVEGWRNLLLSERPRDRQVGVTRKGPHRDDFAILIDGRDARRYASEGQQKGTVLALRIAEFFFLKGTLGVMPMLLADDVLGELDPSRRANFRKLLPPDAQTLATGTEYPSKKEQEVWETYEVREGEFFLQHLDSSHE